MEEEGLGGKIGGNASLTEGDRRPWVAQNENFTYGVAFHFSVADNRRDFNFGMWVEHSKS